MNDDETKAQRLVGLCMLGVLLFNFPVLSLFNKPIFVAGIPLIYAYIFLAWAVLVGLMAVVARTRGRD
jgi:hypothetical protein